ncbi:MAG: tyrosine-protein phosphatase, partial [Pseudomonadota bacterium]
LAKLPEDILRPLMRSDPIYIEAAISQLEDDYGSVMGFIQNELDVSDEELVLIRNRLLTN